MSYIQGDVFEVDPDGPDAVVAPTPQGPPLPVKRAFDQIVAVMLLPLLAILMVLLIAVNPIANRGPLWFWQDRMGYRCRRFSALKFRTMRHEGTNSRGAFDQLETDRITPLGRLLRKSRIDELPQIINVLRGEMSLIGPRPDSYDHACVYVRVVPGYRHRHQVMPGISGLAQTEIGYVDGLEGVRRKVSADLHYIANTTLTLDLWIAWRTIIVVLSGRGA
ncbi:sugar transferase [Yoonia sp. SS1-5]|uniref:Sugar transferase n=1 Tax=Yoonia rhodophyticola TaxID=3137370 RepID=A0AAN0M9H2_9RHOB